ncbi:DNA polymerase, partial [Candidatus Magnetobacterium casense]
IKEGKLTPLLTQVLRIRQQAGLSSTAKYEALIEALCEDSRLRDTLVYHAAQTGRWGGQLVQLQNLPKGTIKDTDTAIGSVKEMDLETLRLMYGDILGLLSSCIRGMFIASPGHDLIVSDYSAVEARVLMWLAGQDNAIKMFADGVDIYTKMANAIGGGATRDLGKTTILGAGYGMGHVKFQSACATKGITVTIAEADRAINAYRASFAKVPQFWRDQEHAVRTAILTKQPVAAGKVTWEYRGDFLYCLLPSGRSLAYHKARVEGSRITYMTTIGATHTKTDTYGGRIVENITQAVARDLLAWAMVRAERAGYPIVLSVHDELVAEVPEGFGSVEAFNEVITKVPKWAAGCPIKAEGWRGKRYKK